ncbi:MAG TPA: ankyrin repeat domain-containing protein, partial [Polyangiales bacterium]|nr:ankyrin repeat domain-containing protein [Polyangiales bacterium]
MALRDKAGQTLLHRACALGKLDDVRSLLDKGADVNARDNAHWTPLHEAALAGHAEVVELLLERGADVRARGLHRDTPLHDACSNGHMKVMMLLVKFGADATACNSKGLSARDMCSTSTMRAKLTSAMRAAPRKPRLQDGTARSSPPRPSGNTRRILPSSSSSSSDNESVVEERNVFATTTYVDETSRREQQKLQRLMSTIQRIEARAERKQMRASGGPKSPAAANAQAEQKPAAGNSRKRGRLSNDRRKSHESTTNA